MQTAYYYLLTIIFITGMSSAVFSQEDEENKKDKQTGIYLNTEETVQGNSIELDLNSRPFMYVFEIGNDYVRVDGKEYDLSRIRFIMMDSAYLAVVKELAKPRVPDVAARIINGKINVYKATLIKKNLSYGIISRKDFHFFNRGKGMVEKLRYGNIKDEYRAETESMQYLKKHLTMKVLEYSLMGISVGLFSLQSLKAYNQYKGYSRGPSDVFLISPFNDNFGNFFLNAAIIALPYMLSGIPENKKEEYILDSVKAYNFNNQEK